MLEDKEHIFSALMSSLGITGEKWLLEGLLCFGYFLKFFSGRKTHVDKLYYLIELESLKRNLVTCVMLFIRAEIFYH